MTLTKDFDENVLCAKCHSVGGCVVDLMLHSIKYGNEHCEACHIGGPGVDLYRCYGTEHVQTPAQAQMRKDKGSGHT